MRFRNVSGTAGATGTIVGARLLTGAILCLAVGLAAVPATAGDHDLPLVGDGETLTSLVLVADVTCPDPPAHLPVVGFRLQLGDLESPVDPMTQEILASKEIRVELTMFRDGFEKHRSESFALRSPAGREPGLPGPDGRTVAESTTIGDLAPGVVHFARALALVGDAWAPTATIRFTTPICAVDGLDEVEVAP